ncbi:MAG: cell division protein FtsZ [Candidatus Lokiarchaeota archaeon]|nr:cell division protein FtsZ [Candidatus Lokiarchaeota archaeon]
MESLIRNARKHVQKPPENRGTIGQAKIVIVGAGGAGNNTVDRLMRIGILGAICISINTDQQHLDSKLSDKRILIGKTLTRGLGAGGQPEIGRAAAEESRNELDTILNDADLVFITCGLGGGTGTGSSPIVAEIAKLNGAMVVGVVTLPFKTEMGRLPKAQEGLKNLRRFTDTVVVLDNNKLLEIAPDLPIIEAFSLADEVLATMVKGITETVSLPSLINLDYADVRTILSTGGVAFIGIGESHTEKGNRVEEAIQDALSSPLLEIDISGAKGALIHVTGGNDMTLTEANKVSEYISTKMDKNAMVIWGARVDSKIHNYIRVMLLITGIKSPQVLGSSINHTRYPSSPIIRNLPQPKPKLSDELFSLPEMESQSRKKKNTEESFV